MRSSFVNGVCPLILFVLQCLSLQSSSAKSHQNSFITPQVEQELRECKANWPKVSKNESQFLDCMSKLFFAVAPRATSPDGIPEIGLKTASPYVVDEVELGQEGTAIQGKITNLRIFNIASAFSDRRKMNFSYDSKRRVLTLAVILDEVSAVADYKMSLNLAGLLASGQSADPEAVRGRASSGEITNRLTGVKANIELFLREKRNDGGLVVSMADAKITVDNSVTKFKSKQPDDPIENLLNAVSGGGPLSVALLNELMAPFNRGLASIVGTIFHQGWQKLDRLI